MFGMDTRFILALLLGFTPLLKAADELPPPNVATFSIVGFDPETGEVGVAVQSKFIAVGAVVPWAKAGVGAVATQAWANPNFGPDGLRLLAEGKSPKEVIELLKKEESGAISHRQVGIVSVAGEAASFTGDLCRDWAGGRSGKNYAVQGNLLAGEAVVEAMAESFEKSAGKAVLSQRLIDALKAGQEAGGDKRGRQSAALLVVREGWGYSGNNDRFRDLRVDDHETPIAELQRIYDLHRKLFKRPKLEKKPDEKGE